MWIHHLHSVYAVLLQAEGVCHVLLGAPLQGPFGKVAFLMAFSLYVIDLKW